MLLRQLVSFIIIGQVAISACLSAEELHIRTPSGENVTVEVDPTDSFVNVINQIETFILDGDQEEEDLQNLNFYAYQDEAVEQNQGFRFLFDFKMGKETAAKKVTRDYYAGVSTSQKQDIRYIVTTLGTNAWYELLKKKSSLEAAGDRIDSVHPLRFFGYIFTDEELKAGIHSIRTNSKVWKKFFNGFSTSLDEETDKKNMTNAFIQDFANTVGIDVNAIQSSLQQRRWVNFVDILLEKIPRNGDHRRYD